jgi:glycosyltransferase involved in cell wall biosynthesis
MTTKPEQSLDILGLIPAHNESPQIADVIHAVQRYLPVLVIDDGSTDGTSEVARSAGAEILVHETNLGKGAALKTGMQQALNLGYAAMITLDGDGQHDPEEIPLFIKTFREDQADLIIGERDYNQIPGIRRYSNTIGRWSLSWALGVYIPDNQSGYRLLSRRMMEATLSSPEQGFQLEVDMITICLLNGYRLAWVPIRTIYTGGSSHMQKGKQIVEFTRMVLETRKRMKNRAS